MRVTDSGDGVIDAKDRRRRGPLAASLLGDGVIDAKGGRRRGSLAITLLAVLGAVLSAACESAAGPQAVIHKQDGGELVVRVEIADDREEQARGLMYRTELAADAGMLFLFDQEQPRAFWMKNTPLPLDIIYIAKDGRIVSIAEHTTPFSTAAIPSGAPAQSVLEVNAGYAKRHGVRAGDRVEARGLP